MCAVRSISGRRAGVYVCVRHLGLRLVFAFPIMAEVFAAMKTQCHFLAACNITVASGAGAGCVGTSVGNRTGRRGLRGRSAPANSVAVAGCSLDYFSLRMSNCNRVTGGPSNF